MPDLAPAGIHLQRLNEVFFQYAEGLLRIPDRLSLHALPQVVDDLHRRRYARIGRDKRLLQLLPQLLAQSSPKHPADSAEPRPPRPLDGLIDRVGFLAGLYFRRRRELIGFARRLGRLFSCSGRFFVFLSPE